MVQINGVFSTSSGFSGQADAEGGREFDFIGARLGPYGFLCGLVLGGIVGFIVD